MTQSFSQLQGILKDFFDVPAVHDLINILPSLHNGSIEWPDITFDQPWILWGLVAVPIVMTLFWAKRQPAVGHSRLPKRKRSLRGAVTFVLLGIMALSVGAGTAGLIGARAHPEKVEVLPGDVMMVRDLHFVIERTSGDMAEYIGSGAHAADTANSTPPPGTCGTQINWGPRKIDSSVYAACKIAEAFPSDRKALATFDANTQCCAPGLNPDPRFFNQRLRYVNKQLADNNVTNFEDKNGVFQTMLDFIKQKSSSQARVLLVFTDGDGTLTDEAIKKYVDRIKAMHVLLICGGPGKDTVATDPESDAIVKVCKQSGGIIVDISTDRGVNLIIDTIKGLPPSEVKLQSRENQKPIHTAFLLFSAIAWGFAAMSWGALGRIR